MIVGAVKGEGGIEIGHNINLGYFAQNQADELDSEKTVFETQTNNQISWKGKSEEIKETSNELFIIFALFVNLLSNTCMCS
mgnify:CR=1 FL=1